MLEEGEDALLEITRDDVAGIIPIEADDFFDRAVGEHRLMPLSFLFRENLQQDAPR